jgi:DNA-directed RNA polymerase specialized sigma24 family protein
LPPRLRVTFDQRVLEDLSYDEIALSQRITSANARKRVQQARAQLRRRLAGPTGRALIE